MTKDGVDRILDQWSVERPDLDTEAMGVLGRIYRIAKAVGDEQAAVYAGFGITRADFDVLATLRRAGAPYLLSPSALTSSLMITSGGITGRVDRLEKAGLVRRSPDPRDRRGQLVGLTERGLEVIDEAVGAGLAAQQEFLSVLSPAKRKQLDSLLRQLLAGRA